MVAGLNPCVYSVCVCGVLKEWCSLNLDFTPVSPTTLHSLLLCTPPLSPSLRPPPPPPSSPFSYNAFKPTHHLAQPITALSSFPLRSVTGLGKSSVALMMLRNEAVRWGLTRIVPEMKASRLIKVCTDIKAWINLFACSLMCLWGNCIYWTSVCLTLCMFVCVCERGQQWGDGGDLWGVDLTAVVFTFTFQYRGRLGWE